MIKTKEQLRFCLQEDAKVNKITSVWKYYKDLILSNNNAHVYRYLKVLRNCEYHYNNSGVYHKILAAYYRIRKGSLGLKYHIDIPLNVAGYGLRLLHTNSGGVVLNASKIGNYCSFNCGILLGQKGPTEKPVIGDHVFFTPGAKAIGGITIGNHVVVAQNAVVVKDVPDYSIVGGVPAKIIRKIEQE